jgi:hypothetical protein
VCCQGVDSFSKADWQKVASIGAGRNLNFHPPTIFRLGESSTNGARRILVYIFFLKYDCYRIWKTYIFFKSSFWYFHMDETLSKIVGNILIIHKEHDSQLLKGIFL